MTFSSKGRILLADCGCYDLHIALKHWVAVSVWQDKVITLLYSVSIHCSTSRNYRHDKEWLVAHIQLCLSLNIQLVYCVILTAYKLTEFICLICLDTYNAVLNRLCRNCYNIYALLYVKISRLSIAQSVIIINSVCDVTVLLCLKKCNSTLDRVYCTRIYLNEIPLLNRDLSDNCLLYTSPSPRDA